MGVGFKYRVRINCVLHCDSVTWVLLLESAGNKALFASRMASISATLPPPDHRSDCTFSRDAFVGYGYLHCIMYGEALRKGNMGGKQESEVESSI